MILGCHVQMKAPLYLEGSVKEGLSYGCDAMMVYTGAPQNTVRKDIDTLHIAQAQELMKEHHLPMERLIVHAPYIINPANSVKPEVAELARQFLQLELERTAAIGAKYLVLHPGSYTTTDLETGIATIVRQLNAIEYDPYDVIVCLETMAGKGSEVGFRFEQLAEILYFDDVLDTFDHVIGLERLHVIHLNDSKNVQGARKDRHANIGMGEIGFEALHKVAENKRTEHIAKILETPYIDKKPPYKQEIAMLRSGKFEPIASQQADSAK